MKTSRYWIMALLALTATCASAVTRDLTNNEGVMGCSTYYQARDQNRGWVWGFLIAQENRMGTNLLVTTDKQHVYNIFDRYCRVNPNRTLYEAAGFTINALR